MDSGESLSLVFSLSLESTLISTGSKFVLSGLSTSPGRFSGTSELISSLGCSRLNSGNISLSSKGKSHSTQASTFDLGVLLLYTYLWLLKLYGLRVLWKSFFMKSQLINFQLTWGSFSFAPRGYILFWCCFLCLQLVSLYLPLFSNQCDNKFSAWLTGQLLKTMKHLPELGGVTRWLREGNLYSRNH